MTIAGRHYFLIAFVIILAATLSGFGIYQTRTVFASANYSNENIIPGLQILADTQAGLAAISGAMWSHLAVATPSQKQAFADQIHERRLQLIVGFQKYNTQYLSNEGDHDLMLRGQQAFGAFENLLGRALALSSEGKENQARALLIANQATIDATTKALLAHREFKAQTGRERAEEAVLALARATQLSILVACAAIVFVVYKGLTMVRYISRSLKRVVQIAVDIADGNLCHDFGVAAKDEIGELMTALEQMNGALVRIVSEVRAGTASVASATEEIACGNEHLSARTEQQAGALEETASTMEQLTATVQQNAGNAEQAEQLASTALKYASEGGVTVELVVQTMMAIDATSRKIADITAVVDSIAFQTNILALNAAVEAARAGEQGRGFAVVAGEVRTLAHRAACAASEIKVLIGKSVSEVQAGGRLVIDAGAGMKQVVDSVRSVSAVVAAITLASKEQSAGIGQINTAIIQIDGTTQQNAALVVQASAAAASLRDQASSLYDTVSLFKTS